MDNDNDDIADRPLSDDPEENLRMENELLRLKLKAELGAEPYCDSGAGPEIENEFLKNVLAFEHNFANSKPTKVFDLLGRPDFKKADELTDSQLEQALQELMELMNEKNMDVYFGDGPDSRTRYNFITEELFEHETTFISMPGMVTNFDYEEFHPNHKNDIENRAAEFLHQWFKRDFAENSWELADQFVQPNGQTLTKAEFLRSLKNVFDAYTSFSDEQHKFLDISFRLDESNGTGLGHAEGVVKYKATLENGGNIILSGPFKFYLALEYGWWSIFHVIFPGFQY